MPEVNCTSFQETVGEVLVRHRSILDVLSKQQESSARVNRAIAKAVTSCGCLEISARRQEMPDDASFLKLKEFMETHLNRHSMRRMSGSHRGRTWAKPLLHGRTLHTAGPTDGRDTGKGARTDHHSWSVCSNLTPSQAKPRNDGF